MSDVDAAAAMFSFDSHGALDVVSDKCEGRKIKILTNITCHNREEPREEEEIDCSSETRYSGLPGQCQDANHYAPQTLNDSHGHLDKVGEGQCGLLLTVIGEVKCTKTNLKYREDTMLFPVGTRVIDEEEEVFNCCLDDDLSPVKFTFTFKTIQMVPVDRDWETA